MAGMLLGIAGGMAFGPLGAIAGSLLASLLFPETREGPRLKNLHLQGSDYGKMIPIVYANFRLAGNVDFTTDLQEHRHESGGKGGPRVITYTYTASFSVLWCEGEVASVPKLWANSTITLDDTGATPNLPEIPIVTYFGTDDQLPDPTLETILGVGNVSARRGYCYSVFTDWDLGEFGNTLPQLNALICKKDINGANGPIERIAENYDMPVSFRVPSIIEWTMPGTQIVVSEVRGSASEITGLRTPSTTTYPGGAVYNTDLTYVGPGGGPRPLDFILCNEVPFARGQEYNMASIGFYKVDPTTTWALWCRITANNAIYPGGKGIADPVSDYWPQIFSPNFLPGSECDIYDYIPGATYDGFCHLVALGVGNVNINYPKGIELGSYFGVPVGLFVNSTFLSADGTRLYLLTSTGVTANMTHWYEIIGGVIARDGAITPSLPRRNFGFGNNSSFAGTASVASMAENNGRYIWLYANNFAAAQQVGGAVAIYEINPSTLVMAQNLVCGVCEVGGPAGSSTGGSLQVLKTGYAGIVRSDGRLAVFTRLTNAPEPTFLYEVLNDQSARCGLADAQRFTDNQTQVVYGYCVDRQSDSRTIINQLQPWHFFDGVERDGVAVFVNRGSEPVVTIPQNDLATQSPGENSLPVVGVKRTQEQDIAATLYVSFFNPDNDYQVMTQYARRQVTQSQAVSRVEFPIVAPPNVGASVAWANLTAAWIERNKIEINTARKYWKYEPTDVINVPGYTVRITRKIDMPIGSVRFEGVATNAQVWVAGPVPGGGGGFTPSPPTPKSPSTLLLLDVPLQRDGDAQFGKYAAMSGTVVGAPYTGTVLYESVDSGASYQAVASNSVADIIGTANDVLGVYRGGNFFDEVNSVTVTIGGNGGNLESFTQAAVLNGAGLYLLGNEYFQACVATEVSAGVWQLSSLLRGRRGTEWAMGAHAVGERFVYLPVTNVTGVLSDLGQSRLYKAVAAGFSLASVTAQAFTNNGASALPYSPQHVGGGPIDPFDGTVQINWLRRTRVGGAWVDFVNVPLSEATEAYVVQIWDSTFSNVARIIQVVAPTCTYTAAQQVADFGAIQEHIYCTVGQVGAYRLGTQTPATIPGSGSGDDPVLVPIPPYNSAPPPPAGGCVLPIQSGALDWATPNVRIFNPAASDAAVWVITLITGASPISTIGKISIAEWSGPPVLRVATISLTPCGPPLGGARYASVGGTAPLLFFYMLGNPAPADYPTLLPSTTYYISVTSAAPSGASALLQY